MPELPPEQASHWSTGQTPVADETLDLRGQVRHDALAALEKLLFADHPPGHSVIVAIDTPTPGQGETLFQPVGQVLLAARRVGRLTALRPLPPGGDTGGFFISFK